VKKYKGKHVEIILLAHDASTETEHFITIHENYLLSH
jgi:hypothetical protein